MNRATILEEIRRNVDLLSVTDQPEYQYIPLHQKPSPSVTALREIMTLLRKVIFPGFFGTEQEAQTSCSGCRARALGGASGAGLRPVAGTNL